MQELNVLVSGFNPYHDVDDNPSLLVPQTLAQQGLDYDPTDVNDPLYNVNVHIHSVMLEVSFTKAWPLLRETIEQVKPQIVIATGLKRASRGILLERCAENKKDTSRPDADNIIPTRPKIDENGPAAYWTGLPLRAILQAFTADHIPATLSSDAGTFVCNALFYRLQDWMTHHDHMLAGFVNLPLINEQPHPQHGLPLRSQVTAVQDMVRETVRYYVRNGNGGELLI
ncbi:pyroglutamyl-peptidase I [Bifidobacterium magnum]|uniref:Pyroglutamyl-peptidase I n=1 Tax=Bifidobacterium magnum TaxID=1692 RepID=A0A087BB75_9BIFI|nr:pyroglutamyl-peptidase I [Bifidobacterium magnum]KFI68275.1 Pyroglutamyl peptidase [Bifidobacterium magnum]